MISPVWLRTFCSVVEVGHFTRAAETLHMTQSGVSQHVRKLEEQLGQSLLIRQGKSFSLTNTGDRLYQEGRKLILSLENLEQQVGIDPSHEGVVRVASPGSVGVKLYPQLLALQKCYPELVIDYRFSPNSDIERLIADQKIDVGLMSSLSSLSEVNLRSIAEETLLLVTPVDVAEPSWDQLMGLGFIDHPDGVYHADQLLAVNYPEFQHSNQFKRSGFSNQINLILEPVSMGLGFTVLPSHAVKSFKEAHKLKVHSLANEVSEVLYVATHTNKLLPNRVKTVITEIEKCLYDL